jgi:aspartate aminotransferase
MPFSSIYTSINESATLAITKKVRMLKQGGQDIIGLTLGEPDFDTPRHIKEAAKQAIDDNFTHYPPVAGIPELRQAIAQKLQRENGLTYKPENIIVSTGAKQCLFNVFSALLNKGDEVLLPTPCWVSYREMMSIAGADIHEIECSIEEHFKLTPQKLTAHITAKTKLLVISSPSNPTGSIYTRDEIAALVCILEKYPDVYIISDEIYEHLAYNHTHVSFASFSSIFERCVVINGVSKAYAMTGWRLGYMASANKELVYLCEKVQGQVTSGANSITQKAVVAALNGPMEEVWKMKAAFEERRNWMHGKLLKINSLRCLLADGAFYFYPDISAFLGKQTPNGKVITDVEELCLYLIDCGVAVIPGSAFGTKNHIRISYAYSMDELKKGVERLNTGLSALV